MQPCTHRIVIECWPGWDLHNDHSWLWRIEELIRTLENKEEWIATPYTNWERTYQIAIEQAHKVIREQYGWD